MMSLCCVVRVVLVVLLPCLLWVRFVVWLSFCVVVCCTCDVVEFGVFVCVCGVMLCATCVS